MTKFYGIQFYYWDDGQRICLVCLRPKFGWEYQQQGKYLFLGICYLAWGY